MKFRIAVFLLLWAATGLQAIEIRSPAVPHIVVVGYGRVAVEPDQALVQLQITRETQTVESAKQQIDQQVNRYLDFLRRSGIPPAHIDATRLQSRRIMPEDPEKESHPVSYRLTRQVTVTVKPLTILNQVIEEALRSDLQELQPVSFGVADDRSHRLHARDQAIQDATTQAANIATQFNSQRGKVYSIRYQPMEPFPRVTARALLLEALPTMKTDQSYLPPTLYFTDQVEVIFMLKAS
jgi:uncharacterized protein